MNKLELLAELANSYLDKYGLVKPQKTIDEDDNGPLFTSVAQILSSRPFQISAIDTCFLEPGLLARKPKGVNSSQEQWDDYLGVAVASLYTNSTNNPRDILWYGVRNGFLYNTDSRVEFKDFLGRFFFVFFVMFAAAFPRLKWLVWFPLTVYCASFKPTDITQTSPLQLQWLFLMGHSKLFGPSLYNRWYTEFKANTGKKLSDMFEIYYEKGMPFVEYIKTNLD